MNWMGEGEGLLMKGILILGMVIGDCEATYLARERERADCVFLRLSKGRRGVSSTSIIVVENDY